MSVQKYVLLSGSGSVSNGTQTIAIIAAPAANQAIRLTAGVLAVTVAATGGGGIVSLKDGTNVIQSWDVNAISNFQFTFGESIGYPLTVGNALNLTVSAAVTNQATVFCMVVGYRMG